MYTKISCRERHVCAHSALYNRPSRSLYKHNRAFSAICRSDANLIALRSKHVAIGFATDPRHIFQDLLDHKRVRNNAQDNDADLNM